MSKTKVLIFLPHLIGGGAERVSVNIIKQLDRELFEVTLLVLSREHSVYDTAQLDVNLIELNASKTLYSLPKLRKAIREISPDIIFSTLFRAHIALYLCLLGLKCKAKLLLRSPNSPKLLLEHKQMGLLSQLLIARAYARADLVIAQTPQMREEIIRYHGVSQSKVRFFLNPLDTQNIDAMTKEIDSPFDANYINVVASGRITAQKGFDLLIESFAQVVGKNRAFRLHIIGQDADEEQSRLEAMVRDLGLQEHIFFLGYQSNPYRYYRHSDLYVLSSRWEGLPNTVLENLYLNKPIVSTRCIPFMESLIAQGDNGYLVDIEDRAAMAEKILAFRELRMRGTVNVQSGHDVNTLFLNTLKGEKQC